MARLVLPLALHKRAERDGIAHRHARVQRRVRILKHHLHLPAQCIYGNPGSDADGIAIEHQFTAVGFDEMQHQAREGGFAATRFADDAECLALADCE